MTLYLTPKLHPAVRLPSTSIENCEVARGHGIPCPRSARAPSLSLTQFSYTPPFRYSPRDDPRLLPSLRRLDPHRHRSPGCRKATQSDEGLHNATESFFCALHPVMGVNFQRQNRAFAVLRGLFPGVVGGIGAAANPHSERPAP